MKLFYTPKARLCLTQVAGYLKESDLSGGFMKKHIQELRQNIRNLLTTFPEAGIEQFVDGVNCRRVVIKEYSILYNYESNSNQIHILLIFKHNLPSL